MKLRYPGTRRLYVVTRMFARQIPGLLLAPEVAVPEHYAKFVAASAAPGNVQPNGKVALLTSFLMMRYVAKFEGAIAAGLQQRGWRVEVLAPLSILPLAEAYHRKIHGLRVHCYEDYVDIGDLRQIDDHIERWFARPDVSFAAARQWTYRDAPVGIHSLATNSFANHEGRVDFDRETRSRLRATLRRSMLWVEAALRVNASIRPSLIVANEKGLVGNCEIFYAATRSNIDFVQWCGCQESNATVFKRYRRDNERDHPFSLGSEAWGAVRSLPWSEQYRQSLFAILQRGYREGAWFRYKRLTENQRQSDRVELLERLRLDPNKPTAIIYSHVLNDANLFYGEDLFQGGYEEWLVQTVRSALTNPRVNWVLKVHPANRGRNKAMGYTGEYGEVLAIKRAFGSLPQNLRIVYPEDDVSPLSYFGITDWGLTVRGTVGLELPCFGIPVVTAGTGRYSRKGFTEDSRTAEEYLQKVSAIDRIPRLTEDQVRLAILYALAVFRARPARHGEVFVEVDPDRAASILERDLTPAPRIGSLQEAVAQPQWQRIVNFLVDGESVDFIDARGIEEEKASVAVNQ